MAVESAHSIDTQLTLRIICTNAAHLFCHMRRDRLMRYDEPFYRHVSPSSDINQV